MKTLIALAATVAVLSSSACCWPFHEGRHHRYDGWSDESRSAPPSRPQRDDRDRYRR